MCIDPSHQSDGSPCFAKLFNMCKNLTHLCNLPLIEINLLGKEICFCLCVFCLLKSLCTCCNAKELTSLTLPVTQYLRLDTLLHQFDNEIMHFISIFGFLHTDVGTILVAIKTPNAVRLQINRRSVKVLIHPVHLEAEQVESRLLDLFL